MDLQSAALPLPPRKGSNAHSQSRGQRYTREILCQRYRATQPGHYFPYMEQRMPRVPCGAGHPQRTAIDRVERVDREAKARDNRVTYLLDRS